jgi:hypothetical protein
MPYRRRCARRLVHGRRRGAARLARRTRQKDPADAESNLPSQAVTHPGALWLLGEHRLFCCDSTDVAFVARTRGQDRAALLFISLPYGNRRDYSTGGVSD